MAYKAHIMSEMYGLSYSNIFLTAAAILVSIAIVSYSWIHRKVTGAKQILIMALLGITWGICYLLELFSSSMVLKFFWNSLQFIPVVFIPPVFLVFVLIFTGRTETLQKPGLMLISLIPILNVLVIATNNFHHLFRHNSETHPEAEWMIPLFPDYGIWYWVIILFCLLMLILSINILVDAYKKSPRWSRSRIGGVLLGAAVPAVALIISIPVWIFKIPVNITLIALIISITIIAWSLFGDRLLHVIPLAQSTLLGQMKDGVITLDPGGRILDCNSAAHQMPVLSLAEHTGDSLPDLLKEKIHVDLDIENNIDHSQEVEIGQGTDTRTYDMRVSPILTDSKKPIGQLVVFREITRRKLEEVERIHIGERYRAIFNNTNYGIILLNNNGVILENNDQVSKLSGYSNEHILFHSLQELGLGAIDFTKKNKVDLSPQESTLIHANGETIPVEVTSTPITSEGEIYYFITLQDIRERKRAETLTKAALDNVQSRIDELAVLRNVTESLNQASTYRAAILAVLETVVSITKSQNVWVSLVRTERAYERWEYHPLDEERQLAVDYVQAGHPKCIQKLLEGRVEAPRPVKNCVCSSLSLDQNHFTLPLYIGKTPLGVLNFTDDSGVQTNENKIRLLHTVCDSLAVAIERIRLFKNESEQRKLADTMRDIGTTLTASLDLNEVLDLLLDQLSYMINYDGGNVMFIEENKARVARHRGYEQVTRQQAASLDKLVFEIDKTPNLHRLIRTQKATVIADTSTEENWIPTAVTSAYHAWLGVPVIVEGKVEAIFSLDKVEPGFYTQEHAKQVSVFATQASLAIKNARLYSAEKQRINELDGLRATLTGISAELDVSVLLKEIVKRAINLLHASKGEIGLYEPSQKALRILVSENFGPENQGKLVKIGEGLMGKVAETRTPLKVDNYLQWSGKINRYENDSLHSGMAVPMLSSKGELLGVIGVGDVNRERVFTENDIRLLNLFAQQATIALRNAQLFEDAKRRAEEAETLRKAGAIVASTLDQEKTIDLILEQLEQVVPYDSASVLLYHKGVLKVVGGHGFEDMQPVMGMEISLDKKNPGAVVFLENKSKVIKNILEEAPHFNQNFDAQHEVQSWLGVPLTIKDKPIGILSLDARNVDQFSQEHARLITAFADQVAIAIDNARLYANAVQNASQLETLYKLSQEISANLRSQEIYPAIHKATAELMTTEFFSISLIDDEQKILEDVYMMDRDKPVELAKRPASQGLFGKVIKEGKSRLYNTFSDDLIKETGAVLIGDMSEEEISQSLLIIPLKIGSKTTGILSAQSYQPYMYTETDLEMLELLGANAAIAIENARLFSEIQELAITDSMTGLYNRRKFIDLAVNEFNRSRRYERELSAIMIDIDHFKVVNDTYGHSIGDQVLKQLAEVCRNSLRQVDIIARYGGEEFMILLPETGQADALAIAERLRLETATTAMHTTVGDMNITISLGVATLEETCLNLEELLDRADYATYASKDAGRNMVTSWSPQIVQRAKDTGKLVMHR